MKSTYGLVALVAVVVLNSLSLVVVDSNKNLGFLGKLGSWLTNATYTFPSEWQPQTKQETQPEKQRRGPPLDQQPQEQLSHNLPDGYQQSYDFFQEYMRMHSNEQLEAECPLFKVLNDDIHHNKTKTIDTKTIDWKVKCPSLFQRKYLVAYYACPLQAGNRLHAFWNDFIYAILSNRTILWKYYDEQACNECRDEWKVAGIRKFNGKCLDRGSREVCQRYLEMSPWIGSYDAWATTVFSQDKSFQHMTPESLKINPIWDHAASILTLGMLKYKHDMCGFQDPKKFDKIPNLWMRNRTKIFMMSNQRGFLSCNFVYGMLFHYTFSFTKPMLAADEWIHKAPNITTSLAIHSRHNESSDLGTNITLELACLAHLKLPPPCHVYIMSDRPATLHALSHEIPGRFGCQVSFVQHDESTSTTTTSDPTSNRTTITMPSSSSSSSSSLSFQSPSYRREHGPFAGSEFFRDLALASHARHGIVGTERSSTYLLQELILYRRLMDQETDSRDYLFCDMMKERCPCHVVKASELK